MMNQKLNREEPLTLMTNPELETLMIRLSQLAVDAAERAERVDGTPPGYWPGVSFGLHTALDEARQLAHLDAALSAAPAQVITEPNNVQDGSMLAPDPSSLFYASDEADGDADDD